MFNDDTPNIWEEDLVEDEKSTSLQTVTPAEEIAPLPTKEEQLSIIDKADISEEHRGLLSELTEMNEVAKTLATLRDNETVEERKTLIRAWSEAFMTKRLQNNNLAEELKRKLLHRLLDNVDELDLQTTSQIFTGIQEVTSLDAQNALGQIMGGNATPGSGSNGTNITVNVANGDNSSATSNAMHIGSGVDANQLKQVADMGASIKGWSNVEMPRKEKNVTDITATDIS